MPHTPDFGDGRSAWPNLQSRPLIHHQTFAPFTVRHGTPIITKTFRSLPLQDSLRPTFCRLSHGWSASSHERRRGGVSGCRVMVEGTKTYDRNRYLGTDGEGSSGS